MLPHGHVLKDRYKILSTLGRGSFSSVYLADDSNWKGNLVAIKQIRTDGFSEQEYIELNRHFIQEAAFLMTLKHPGLPRVIEFFAEEACYYLALQWIAGKNLDEVVRERGRIEETEVLEWGIQLADVLQYLHTRDPYPVLLGDLKPSNVILQYDGKVTVVDFGVARHLYPDQKKGEFTLVSPGFSAPEQYRYSIHADQRADLYSLAATLYWCLTGANMLRYRFDLPPLRRLRPDANRKLEEVLARCLQVRAELRHGSAWQLGQELKDLLGQMRRDEGQFSPGEILSALYKRKKN